MPSTTSKKNGETHTPLRQLAAEKLHGKDANPTLLGDPVSIAIESTPNDNADGGKEAATSAAAKAGDNQTKKDPVDHDNGPTGSSGSVKKGPASKL